MTFTLTVRGTVTYKLYFLIAEMIVTGGSHLLAVTRAGARQGRPAMINRRGAALIEVSL